MNNKKINISKYSITFFENYEVIEKEKNYNESNTIINNYNNVANSLFKLCHIKNNIDEIGKESIDKIKVSDDNEVSNIFLDFLKEMFSTSGGSQIIFEDIYSDYSIEEHKENIIKEITDIVYLINNSCKILDLFFVNNKLAQDLKIESKKANLGIKKLSQLNNSKVFENFKVSESSIIIRDFKRKLEKYERVETVLTYKYYINSIADLINATLLYLIINKFTINKCENCGRYFIPKYKVSEKYCDNIFKNGKTCKELSYEIKLSNDEISLLYRKAYKTQNARKNRIINFEGGDVEEINNRFIVWTNKAKEVVKKCENNLISMEELEKWFKENSI